jgi:hypothetical protein
LVQKNGTKSIQPFKIDVENLHTLSRLSEWYLSEELPRLIDEMNQKPMVDEIMTVEGAALYMKITPATVYTLINKGKLKKIEISSIDKPGARPAIRIRKSEIERFLGG